VAVSVIDDDGDIGVVTLEAAVLDTADAFENLHNKVESLDLSRGTASSLTAKLKSRIHLLSKDVGSDRAVMAKLDAFVRDATHWRKEGKLSREDCDELIFRAKLIKFDILSSK